MTMRINVRVLAAVLLALAVSALYSPSTEAETTVARAQENYFGEGQNKIRAFTVNSDTICIVKESPSLALVQRVYGNPSHDCYITDSSSDMEVLTIELDGDVYYQLTDAFGEELELSDALDPLDNSSVSPVLLAMIALPPYGDLIDLPKDAVVPGARLHPELTRRFGDLETVLPARFESHATDRYEDVIFWIAPVSLSSDFVYIFAIETYLDGALHETLIASPPNLYGTKKLLYEYNMIDIIAESGSRDQFVRHNGSLDGSERTIAESGE